MIWIIGGTKESKEFMKIIKDKNIDYIYSLLNQPKTKFDFDYKVCEIKNIIKKDEKYEVITNENNYIVDKIIDFSHPHAYKINQLLNVYTDIIRFQRKPCQEKAYSYEQISKKIVDKYKNILLLTGYKGSTFLINLLKDQNYKGEITVRSIKPVEKAKNIYFDPNIDSLESLKKIINTQKFDLVVLKDSGINISKKIELIKNYKIDYFVVKMPQKQGNVFYEIKDILYFISLN